MTRNAVIATRARLDLAPVAGHLDARAHANS